MNIGDVVVLKSGGLPMTIKLKNVWKGDMVYTCVWHDVNGHIQYEVFMIELLKKVEA